MCFHMNIMPQDFDLLKPNGTGTVGIYYYKASTSTWVLLG